MARIRTIKPEFPQSETIGKLSRDARLLFVQLWTIADDYGRTRAAPRMLASLLYPYDDDAPGLIGGWLAELRAQACVDLYKVGGDAYLEIINWAKHQRIDNAGKSKIPPPSEADGSVVETFREPPRAADSLDTSPLDLGPSTVGPRTMAPEAPPAKDRGPNPRNELALVLDSEHVDAVLEHRKKKRAPLTPRAAKLLAAEFARCPDPNAAADAMILGGWQSFKATWLNDKKSPGPDPPSSKPPPGLRDARSTAEYIAYMIEQTGDPNFDHAHKKFSRHQLVPVDWTPRPTSCER